MIKQAIIDIEVCRINLAWQPKHYFLGDLFTLGSITLSLSAQKYIIGLNEDMTTYLQQQAQA